MLLDVHHARHRARHGDGLVANRAHVRNHVAVAVEVYVRRSFRWRLLAIVEEVQLTTGTAEEQETATANIAVVGVEVSPANPRQHNATNRMTNEKRKAKFTTNRGR